MSRIVTALAIVVLSLFAVLGAQAQTEMHRATHLGNPATRFADPLKTPEDLRRTLSSETLRDDVQKVARMSGYTGDMADFWAAADSAEIREISIPTGTVLPAMSTRKKGQVDLLRNVLWAGKRPIDAYEFSFISGERRYRVVTPKACANFWVEEQLPPPKYELSLACESPAESPNPYPAMVCCTLRNSGDLTDPKAVLTLPMPAGAKVRCVSGGPDVSDSTRLSWAYDQFAPGASHKVCGTFVPQQAQTILFKASAVGARAPAVSSQSQTRVTESPAELLDVVAPKEPVPVGAEAVYVIRVRNLATWPLTNLKLTGRLVDGQQFVSGSGPTPVVAGEANRVVSGVLANLYPQEQAEWRVVVKVTKAGEAKLEVDLVTDQFFCPLQKSGTLVQ